MHDVVRELGEGKCVAERLLERNSAGVDVGMKLSLLTKTEIEDSQASARVDFWKVGKLNHNKAVEQSALGPEFYKSSSS